MNQRAARTTCPTAADGFCTPPDLKGWLHWHRSGSWLHGRVLDRAATPRRLTAFTARIRWSRLGSSVEYPITQRARACKLGPSVILLAAYRVKDRVFFDGRILPKSVQGMLQEICLALAKQPDDHSRVDGYLRAYERILSRGYAGAAHHTLSKLAAPSSRMTVASWSPVAVIRRRKAASKLVILWLRDRLPEA